MHMLITLAHEPKLRTVEDIDCFISAEIPDATIEPLAFDTVSRFMMHGPCGMLSQQSPCMIDGICSKYYP